MCNSRTRGPLKFFSGLDQCFRFFRKLEMQNDKRGLIIFKRDTVSLMYDQPSYEENALLRAKNTVECDKFDLMLKKNC